eukprot:GEMP01003811.1.p1 GENE.GEMP01003811.1~~GEMP01003811.1.p1  ORF type:complete len:1199 (+),score=262.76 GEMP01003811.1:48-3599(+)
MAAGFRIPAQLRAPLDAKPLGLQLQDATISNVISHSWAHKQGLAAGDKLVSVNKQPIESMSHSEVLSVLRSARPLLLDFLLLVPCSKVDAFECTLHEDNSKKLIKPPQQLPISPAHRAHRKSLRVIVSSCKHPKTVFHMWEFDSAQWRHGIVCDWCGQRTDFLQSKRKIFVCEVCNVFLCDFCGQDPHTGVAEFDAEPWFLEDARLRRKSAAWKASEIPGRAVVMAARSFDSANAANPRGIHGGITSTAPTVVEGNVGSSPEEIFVRTEMHVAGNGHLATSRACSTSVAHARSTFLEDDNGRVALISSSVSTEHENERATAEAKPRPIYARRRSTSTKRKARISTRRRSASTSLSPTRSRSTSSPTRKLPASAKCKPTISSRKPSISGTSHISVTCGRRLSTSIVRRPSSGSPARGTRSAISARPKPRRKRPTSSHPLRKISGAQKSATIPHPRSPSPARRSPSSMSPLKAATKRGRAHSSTQTDKASASQRPSQGRIRKTAAKRRSGTTLSGVAQQKRRKSRSVTIASPPTTSPVATRRTAMKSAPATAPARATLGRAPRVSAKIGAQTQTSRVRPPVIGSPGLAASSSRPSAATRISRRPPPKVATIVPPVQMWSYVEAAQPPYRMAMKAPPLQPQEKPPRYQPPEHEHANPSDGGERTVSVARSPCPSASPPQQGLERAAKIPIGGDVTDDAADTRETSDSPPPPHHEQSRPHVRDDTDNVVSQRWGDTTPLDRCEQARPQVRDETDNVAPQRLGGATLPHHCEQVRSSVHNDNHGIVPHLRGGAAVPRRYKQSRIRVYEDHATRIAENVARAVLSSSSSADTLRARGRYSPASTRPSSGREARRPHQSRRSASPASLSLSPRSHQSQRSASPMSLSLFSRSQQSPRSASAMSFSLSSQSQQSPRSASAMSLSLSPQRGERCPQSVTSCASSPCIRSHFDATVATAPPLATANEKQPLRSSSRLGNLAASFQQNMDRNRDRSHNTNASQAWNRSEKRLVGRDPLHKRNSVISAIAAHTTSQAKAKGQIHGSAIFTKCLLEATVEGKRRGREIVDKMVKSASEEGRRRASDILQRIVNQALLRRQQIGEKIIHAPMSERNFRSQRSGSRSSMAQVGGHRNVGLDVAPSIPMWGASANSTGAPPKFVLNNWVAQNTNAACNASDSSEFVSEDPSSGEEWNVT